MIYYTYYSKVELAINLRIVKIKLKAVLWQFKDLLKLNN